MNHLLPWLRLIRFFGIPVLALCCAFFSQAAAQRSRGEPVTPRGRFDSGNSARGIPFEFHDNHIYLQVKVNDSGPLSFILDTGASSVISRKRAESMGLKFRRKEQGFGVGENAVEASITEGVTIRLPGATLPGQAVAAVDLEGLQKSLGRAVDGILGSGFFSRFVVEIDYSAKIINLHSPGSYEYKGKGERIPLIMDEDSGLIFVRAVVEPLDHGPIKGLFEIDSGGNHTLILNKPFVERNNLLTAAQKANVVSVGGLGNSSRAVLGTVKSLRVGRSLAGNVGTFFSLAAEGMAASGEFDGNIGDDFLRRFKVIFDYPGRSMILESDPAGAT